MRATPRGLAIVAWANVIIGAAEGWQALPAVFVLARVDAVAMGRFLPFALQAVLQVVAGLGMLDLFPIARRYLLGMSIGRLVLAGEGLLAVVTRGATTSLSPLLGPVNVLIAAVTLWYLLRLDVEGIFPPLPENQRFAVDTVVVLILLGCIPPTVPTVPVADRPVQTARGPQAQQRPSYSPQPIRPGTGPATLMPLYDGKPVGDFTASDVRLTVTAIEEKPWMHDGVVRSTQIITRDTIERPWRVHHGRIRISSVPAGIYQVSLGIDRDRADGTGPGDLGGGARVEFRTGHGPMREVVPLQYGISLREPRTGPDPADLRPGMRPSSLAGRTPEALAGEAYDRLPRIPSHVAFSWDPVPGAAKYSLMLACHDIQQPIQAIVPSPSWTTDLPQCPPPHPWRVYVSATGGDGSFVGGMRGGRAFVVDGTPQSRAARGLHPATLTLRPSFDGRPLRHIDATDVSIVLQPAGTALEPTYPAVHVRHGRIKIPGFVPNLYLMGLLIGPDARRRADRQPLEGDLFAYEQKQVSDVHTDWQPESRTIEVQRTMRLVEPEDPRLCGSWSVRMRSPVEIRWEPVPEAVEYTLQVTRRGQALADAQQIVVREPAWRGSLPSSGPDYQYFVKIAARTARGIDVALLQRALVVD
jgi:hypothetical protein